MQSLSRAHLELYRLLKDVYEGDEQLRKEDLLDIYDRYVEKRPRNRSYEGSNTFTDEQLCQNASAWLDRSIAVLVRHKYLGLTFRKETNKELVHFKERYKCRLKINK